MSKYGQPSSYAALIEPGVKSFLKISLQNCKQLKEQYYSTIFNVSAFTLFIFIAGVILFVKYKLKPTPEEREHKIQEQREYVLSKLKLVNAKNFLASKSYSGAGSTSGSSGSSGSSGPSGQITNLPNWNTSTSGHYELFSQSQSRTDEEYFMRMQTN
jgi:hypothetical protein